MADVEQIDFTEWKALPGPLAPPGYDPATSPVIKMAYVANVWIKLMHFVKAGNFVPGHYHNYDHTTLLSSGSVEILANEQTTTFKAPALIYIQKGIKHKITALEDNTVVSCIHAMRDKTTGDIVSEDMVPKGIDATKVISISDLYPIVKTPTSA